jgi:hypothetical protein
MPKNNGNEHITNQELHRFNVSRDQVLTRLWEIANMDPERTRNNMSAQVKAISMIVAIENLIPDRRAASSQNKPASPPQSPTRSASEPTFANRFNPSGTVPPAQHPAVSVSTPDGRVPFSTEKDPFARRPFSD